MASVLGLPIELTAVEEGSAYGAALLGGVAGGMFADVPDAVARCVRVRTTVEPDPAWQSAYEDIYRALRRALSRTRHREGEHSVISLEGKVAVVTGASRGIGAAVARMLADQGVKLGLASRSGDDLGIPGAVAMPTDVRDRAQVAALVEETVARHGGIDIVIANAGVGAYGPFVDLDPAHLDEMMDVNAKGVITTAAATVPHLIARGGGDFVSVASEAGRRGLPFEAVYCASKFAQVGFTRALDHELRPQGVRCTNVCPGGVATDFAMEEGYGRTPDMPELAGMMSADDVAETVLFVLTRPRNHRILEVAFRPMTETSWG